MKVEVRDLEIELVAETELERQALAKIQEHRQITIRPGKSRDRNYPQDPKLTNVIIVLPDPNDWGT